MSGAASGEYERGKEMKKLVIEPTDKDLYVRLYMSASKVDEIAEALRELECVDKVCDLVEAGMVGVQISPRAEVSDTDAMYAMVRRILEEESEPDKPVRHPILDEKWHIGDGVCQSIVYNEAGCEVFQGSCETAKVVAGIPDLLRALEKLDNHFGNCPLPNCVTCAALAGMGIAFG